ncbi:hypothetical protein DITRI_Ditri18aG0011500 [Diplodiscus trichospermus]
MAIAGKRFLLVLDNVRNAHYSTILKRYLESGARGSKIMLTASNYNVVRGCSPRYALHPLTEEDCWSILRKHAFAEGDRSEDKTLEVIAKRIVKECNGYEFDKEELVHLWMAEGFLQQSTTQSMEKVGAECFNDLLKRSIFIQGDNSRFKMHDVMHNLAEAVSHEGCFRLEYRSTSRLMESAIPKWTRHLSFLVRHDNTGNLSAIQPGTDKISIVAEKLEPFI